jgi:hypothetical protein
MRVYKRKGRTGWDRAAFAENYVQHPHRSWNRRRAAQRMVPLECGCGPDPWLCRCSEPPLSDVVVDGWRDAARHVLAVGPMPLVPLEVRRALYRRGRADRELAETLHAGCGGVIA